jgi:hypothetical protein
MSLCNTLFHILSAAQENGLDINSHCVVFLGADIVGCSYQSNNFGKISFISSSLNHFFVLR